MILMRVAVLPEFNIDVVMPSLYVHAADTLLLPAASHIFSLLFLSFLHFLLGSFCSWRKPYSGMAA